MRLPLRACFSLSTRLRVHVGVRMCACAVVLEDPLLAPRPPGTGRAATQRMLIELGAGVAIGGAALLLVSPSSFSLTGLMASAVVLLVVGPVLWKARETFLLGWRVRALAHILFYEMSARHGELGSDTRGVRGCIWW